MKSREEQQYEERLKRRLLILREKLQDGKIHFAESLKDQIDKSISKARFDSNGEPDLDTIDPFLRSLSLMAEHMDHREKMKNAISLKEIQHRYFTIIQANFEHFYKLMVDNRSTPHQIAMSISYSNKDIDFLDKHIELILDDIEKFWELVAESGYLHIEDDFDSIKAVFGGDLFPAHNENIASKCGIYTDTIILPCPFIRSRNMFKVWDKNQRVYYLLKHALNILQYQDLALADLDRPIVAILPDMEMMDEFSFEHIQKLGENDAIYHASKVFGRKFKGFEELLDFGANLDTIEKVFKQIKDPKRVLFDTEFREPLKDQIQNQLNGDFSKALESDNPGVLVSMLGFGRMSVCNELLTKAAKVGGTPLIDAPTSWEYFKWKLEYDSERTYPNKDYSQMHVVKGLNGLNNTSLSWIGKIPPNGLIELRQNGSINEIRSILSRGIDELVQASAFDFTNTSHKVFNNLNFAFNQHQENIQTLINKKWKIAGKDFGSWIVMGSVEIASACIGTPLYGISAAILNQILDPPKLKDLPKSIDQIKQIEEHKNNLRRSPIGLMFNYKK